MNAYSQLLQHPDGPANPWQVLGISPNERDARVIEDAAVRQSAAVRRYQLTHPDEATQRLTAIARASLMCLEPPPAPSPAANKPQRSEGPGEGGSRATERAKGSHRANETRRKRSSKDRLRAVLIRTISSKAGADRASLLLSAGSGGTLRLRLSAKASEQLARLLDRKRAGA